MSGQTYSPKTKSGRVLVALSGGVHSAVTAALLKTQGYEVLGLHLDLGCESGSPLSQKLLSMQSRCCKAGMLAQAEQVARKLGIGFYVADVQDLYESEVVERMAHETVQGRVPNPCVVCNHAVKFSTLLKKAQELGCEWVATGHGAQINHDSRTGMSHLYRASDPARDQSYFLFQLSQSEISKLLLPLGNFSQSMINKLAAEFGFAEAPSDPRRTCYIGSAFYPKFIETRVPPSLRSKGVVRSPRDEVIGEHQGLHFHPIGTRVELEISNEETQNYVVLGSDTRAHALLVGPPDALLGMECLATESSWLRPLNQLKALDCRVRVLPAGEMTPCQVTFFENRTLQVRMQQPTGPLVPGQAVVFYLENELLGGAWIRSK